MTEKNAQPTINHMFLAVITPKTAMEIVNGFCHAAAKAGAPVPESAHEKIAYFRNRGAHYRKEDKNFAGLFSAIALYADASLEATRPTDSTSLNTGRIERERKIYGASSEQSSLQDALSQVDEKLAHAKKGKTRIARDAGWLEGAIHHAMATYEKDNKKAWASIVSTPRKISQHTGVWPAY